MPRFLAFLLALWIAATISAHAHEDRVERPWKITTEHTHGGGTLTGIAFKSGANARFHTAKDGRIAAVGLQSGRVKYEIPAQVAAKLRDVHYPSLRLGWDGLASSPAKSRYVYLEFDTGARRKFGEYPRVQFMFENAFFRKGKFVTARVVKKSGPRTWQSADL
jgi:hypothetical protein